LEHGFLQLTQLPINEKPSFDSVKASEEITSAFYNIGDLELQDNLARIWSEIFSCCKTILNSIAIDCIILIEIYEAVTAYVTVS
jgi:hypothetical protein